MNTKNQYIRKSIFMLSLILLAGPLCAETYELGGRTGWADVPTRNGITTGRGRFGYESLELDTNSAVRTEFTDMLLTFEDNSASDLAGKYTVVKNNTFISKKAGIGKGAALSRNKDGGLVLSGDRTSFFSSEGPAGSFLIDFWICPSVVENGEILLKWRSSRNIGGAVVYQLITLSFYQNRLLCLFSNIFDGWTKDDGDVRLLGREKLVPRRWTHHTIAFQEDTGTLEYRLDGKLEDIMFITSTEHEGGAIYPAVMGVPADVELCPSYSGLLDDFRIMRSFSDVSAFAVEENDAAINPHLYKPSGGRFESIPILTKAGSRMNFVSAEMNMPPQTMVQLYVRAGDNYFNWNESSPEWIPVESGRPIENLSGLYFQVAADLFPDGAGTVTPSVTRITLDYTVLPEPLPPFKVSAEPGDGFVTLSWSPSVDDNVGGYYIYYGTRSGEYLGRTAAEGLSPVNAGNATTYRISGLDNGTIYYFAVSAWSSIDSRVSGPLSKEVYARPSVQPRR